MAGAGAGSLEGVAPIVSAGRLRPGVAQLVALVISGASLAGCSDPDTSQILLDDYLTRIERTLGGEVPEPALLAPPRLIDAELVPVAIPTSGIGVIDFLALSGCELQVNLGRRNSSLGRNASPSQQLLLDLEFLELAPACIGHLQSKHQTELATTLEAAASERKQWLPALIYNAVMVGPEYRDFWRLPPRLHDYPAGTGGAVIDALAGLAQSISRWLAGDFRADNAALEAQLAVLRSGDGGSLLLASARVGRQLERASQLFRQRSTAHPLCPGQRETEAATVAETVVARFFAAGVQAWLAQVKQRQGQLIAPLQDIESQLDAALPPEYLHWRRARDEYLGILELAPKRHVAAIKAAFDGCPGLIWST